MTASRGIGSGRAPGNIARLKAMTDAQKRHYPEEVESMLFLGFSSRDIARAMGVKPKTVERSLYRYGRPDLAKRYVKGL